MAEGEDELAKQATLRAATLHLDQKPPGGQPPYALLHPESPPSLLPPAKAPGGNQLRKPKVKLAVQENDKSKAEARLSKKDKTSGKVKAKKKKTSWTPGMKTAWIG
ncbi:MAG: hypothetical protein WAU47_11060 [Desulfobaccales bacterium]